MVLNNEREIFWKCNEAYICNGTNIDNCLCWKNENLFFIKVFVEQIAQIKFISTPSIFSTFSGLFLKILCPDDIFILYKNHKHQIFHRFYW